MEYKKKFSDFLKNQLNEPQRQAVQGKHPATLVIAGAGSGKTRVITARIANLILNEEIDPASIVALTFTNKAAGEMKERITNFLGKPNKLPFIGTFHSYCLLLLRRNSALLPFPEFSILDADDQVALLRKIITRNALNKYISANQANFQLSAYKNSLLTKQDEDFVQPFIREIYREYEADKASAHCLDFDDLLVQVLNLFSKNSEFRSAFQNRVKHILVDEYQDTSVVQHQLLKFMALNAENKFTIKSLCAVGDEDQSIYSWRGASVANMLLFQKDFAPVSVVKIEQNYRSVQPILDVANKLIENNRLRNSKSLWSSKKAKNRILIGHCRSGDQEASVIANLIQVISKDKNKKLSDIAILYRTHFQSRQIEEALIYHSIPYKIIGGLLFYERKEIKDLLAYLRLVANPFDKISLLRAINCPNRGLGQKFEQELLEASAGDPFRDFKQLLLSLSQTQPPAKQNSVSSFLDIFATLDSSISPEKALETILKETDYLGYLRQEYEPKEAEAKIENVKEFLVAAQLFEKRYSDELVESPTLENFLYEIALLQEKLQKNENQDQVQLMTLHAAKGLEFDTVIISGLDEGLLPSAKALNTAEALEEERRLFYVGITRAREYLLLLSASYRNTFGQVVDQIPSRFLSEIHSGLVKKFDFEKMLGTQVKQTLEEWVLGKSVQSKIVTFSKSVKKKEQSNAASGMWRNGMVVTHNKFGRGVILKVEKTSDDFYLTVAFKAGQKKLLASYVILP
jgi:DNA helicase-2/ATP-dependent DNA helicase PcrA